MYKLQEVRMKEIHLSCIEITGVKERFKKHIPKALSSFRRTSSFRYPLDEGVLDARLWLSQTPRLSIPVPYGPISGFVNCPEPLTEKAVRKNDSSQETHSGHEGHSTDKRPYCLS
jgi:hypothetical protein